MSTKVFTAALEGLNCTIVEVETDYRRGKAYFSIVGLADKSIQEARDRIPSSIRNSGGKYVPMHIVMNLAPAEIHKSGPSYDLPLAVGYLLASEQIEYDFNDAIFIGELALDGRLRPVSGILPIVDGIKKNGFKRIFLPYENAAEASLIEGVEIFGLKHLEQLVNKEIPKAFEKSDIKTIRKDKFKVSLFEDIKGQNHAKRALEIAAAGGHNVLLSGVPGSGKTMLSRSIPAILPEMKIDEMLEVTKIYSIVGETSKNSPLIQERPFRTPHHTSSQTALVGGGSRIRPGEISLAHRGVLFLDEFPEFSVQSLEALRQPLEDKIVTISRASGTLTFPANFILVAAMNPCKCGYLGDSDKECTCTQIEIMRYQKKISGPILDRIDLLVNVSKVKNDDFFKDKTEESSENVRKRVQNAKNLQEERFKKIKIHSNSDMGQKDLKQILVLDEESKDLLRKAMEKLNLTARSYYRVLKVSRTIADLEQSEKIHKSHIQEALSFRVSIGG